MEENSGVSLVYHNPDIRLGFHIGTLSTLTQTFGEVIDLPLRSYQIYIAQEPWLARREGYTDILQTRSLLERRSKYACIHGSLLHNLAGCVNGKTDPKFDKSVGNTVNGLIGELDVAAGFGGGVVVHVGAAKDRRRGIFTVTKTIEACLQRETAYTKQLSRQTQIPLAANRKIILENAAGETNKLGSNLDELAEIVNGVNETLRPRVKICIDTAHIFGAGQYDFGSPETVTKFFEDFDEKLGLDRLELFHLNDSRVAYGSCKDRHDNLGFGHIFGIERDEDENGDGLEGLKILIDQAMHYSIPLIGEPPENTKNGEPAPGALWDYNVVKHICNLEEEHFLC